MWVFGALLVGIWWAAAQHQLSGGMAAVDVEFSIDLFGIVVDCMFGDHKDLGNIPVAVAVADEFQNL